MDYKSNRKKGCRSNDTGGINMEKLIQIKNLTKCFGETKVLDKINVNFDRGHIYGIIGRNGSGKSMFQNEKETQNFYILVHLSLYFS